MILDENLEVCKGINTGIFLDNKFQPADSEGRIIIPFAEENDEMKAILINEDFAELVDIEVR